MRPQSERDLGSQLRRAPSLRNALLVAEEQCDLSRVIMRRRNDRGAPARFTANPRERLAYVGFHAWHVLERWVQQRFHMGLHSGEQWKRTIRRAVNAAIGHTPMQLSSGLTETCRKNLKLTVVALTSTYR